jgi:hypothetical protein
VAKLSISKAWDETREILRRDGKLLATVAAALLVLAGVVRDVATPAAPQGEMPAPGAWIVILIITVIVSIVGQLALIRLAMRERTTVGDAITHAARRAPAYVAAQLIWVLPLVAVMFAVATKMRPPNPSAGAAVVFLLCFVLFVFLSVRLLLSPAVAIQEPVGPIAILKRSWELGRGSWWRLFGFLLLFLVATAAVVLALLAVVGSIVKLFVGAAEPFSIAGLLLSLVSQIALAGAYVLLMVMIARLYAQAAGHREASVPSSGT